MVEYAIVDADSQLAITINSRVAGWHLPQHVTTLRKGGALFFAHSLFGEHHNIFPILVLKIVEDQLVALCKDVLEFTEFHFGAPPDIIVYPAESTAGLIVKQIADIYAEKRPKVFPLTPAFRRWNRSLLQVEVPEAELRIFQTGELRVLFFDDSISSGDTENKAFIALRDIFLGQLHWRTYTVINRGTSPESIAPKPRMKARRKGGIDTHDRGSFIEVGPPSLDASRCPLCQGSERMELALEWAAAGRRGVVAKLESAKEILTRRSLHDGGAHGDLIPAKIEEATLLLSYTQFQHACLMVTQETPKDSSKNIAKFLFVALNFVDACAYIGHRDFRLIAAAALEAVESDDSEFGPVLLVALALVPLALLQEIAATVLLRLMAVEAVNLGGAMLSLLISRHYEEMRRATRSGFIKTAKATELQRRFLDQVYENLLQPDAFIDQKRGPVRQALISDLNLLRHKPDQRDQLWNVRVLAALLHLGNHESFLIRELRMLDTMRDDVRSSLLHCLGLLAQLVKQLSPGREKDVELAIAEIDKQITPEGLKAKGEAAVQRFWRQFVEADYIYDSPQLVDHIESSIIVAGDMLRREGGRSADGLVDLMRIASRPAGLPKWRVFGPHFKYLQEHFENMFINAVKHFYADPMLDWRVLFSRLAQDSAFRAGGPLVWVTFHVDVVAELLYLVFSDRAAAPVDSALLSKYSGLSSCRAHMQIKGGDVFHFTSAERNPLLTSIEAAVTANGGIFSLLTNHFVTKMPLLLSYKTHREDKK